jgi:hypothetical protein
MQKLDVGWVNANLGTTVVIDQIKLVDVIGNRRNLEESLTFVME